MQKTFRGSDAENTPPESCRIVGEAAAGDGYVAPVRINSPTGSTRSCAISGQIAVGYPEYTTINQDGSTGGYAAAGLRANHTGQRDIQKPQCAAGSDHQVFGIPDDQTHHTYLSAIN